MSSDAVRLVEVGPRDGLQNEPQVLPVETRIRLIERLVAAGLRDVEVGAFVSPLSYGRLICFSYFSVACVAFLYATRLPNVSVGNPFATDLYCK